MAQKDKSLVGCGGTVAQKDKSLVLLSSVGQGVVVLWPISTRPGFCCVLQDRVCA